MASIGVGPEHQPGAAVGHPAAAGDMAAADPAAGNPAVICGHPHERSTREVGYP
jgi:hypothetical protein